jgi:hypothetical protein
LRHFFSLHDNYQLEIQSWPILPVSLIDEDGLLNLKEELHDVIPHQLQLPVLGHVGTQLHLQLNDAVSSVADPDDFGPDLDPDLDLNLEKNQIRPLKKMRDPDPDPALCKILYQLVVTRNFCLKID